MCSDNLLTIRQWTNIETKSNIIAFKMHLFSLCYSILGKKQTLFIKQATNQVVSSSSPFQIHIKLIPY